MGSCSAACSIGVQRSPVAAIGGFPHRPTVVVALSALAGPNENHDAC